MNQEAKDRILKVYGNPVASDKDGRVQLVFARQSPKDAEEIEKMPDDKLIEEWKELCWINHIYGQVSMSELQRIDLIEAEMDDRKGIDAEELRLWFDEAKVSWNESESYDTDYYNISS